MTKSGKARSLRKRRLAKEKAAVEDWRSYCHCVLEFCLSTLSQLWKIGRKRLSFGSSEENRLWEIGRKLFNFGSSEENRLWEIGRKLFNFGSSEENRLWEIGRKLFSFGSSEENKKPLLSLESPDAASSTSALAAPSGMSVAAKHASEEQTQGLAGETLVFGTINDEDPCDDPNSTGHSNEALTLGQEVLEAEFSRNGVVVGEHHCPDPVGFRKLKKEEAKVNLLERLPVIGDDEIKPERPGSDSGYQTKERDDPTEEHDDLTKERDDVTKERDDLKKKCDDLTKERDDVTKERDDLTKERDDLTKECDDLKKEHDDLTKERDDVTKVMILTKKRDDLMKECDDLTKERDDVTKERDDLKKKCDDLTKERDDVMKERDDVMKERDDMKKERDDLTKERDDVTKERDDLTKECDDVTKERDDLSKTDDDMKKKSEVFKIILLLRETLGRFIKKPEGKDRDDRLKEEVRQLPAAKCEKIDMIIAKSSYSNTLRTMKFQGANMPLKSNFSCKDWREHHRFPNFKNGDADYQFWEENFDPKTLERRLGIFREAAKNLDPALDMFVIIELVSQLNSKLHPQPRENERNETDDVEMLRLLNRARTLLSWWDSKN